MFSALPLEADIALCSRHVSKVPTEAEVTDLFNHPVGVASAVGGASNPSGDRGRRRR
jgi:hypothetical protein